jgi:hypothetical protein
MKLNISLEWFKMLVSGQNQLGTAFGSDRDGFRRLVDPPFGIVPGGNLKCPWILVAHILQNGMVYVVVPFSSGTDI